MHLDAGEVSTILILFIVIIYLLKDGASIHTSNAALNFLHGIFGNRVMSSRSRSGLDWAPNSPDLNPCDFWLHGFMKVSLCFYML